MAIVSPYLIGKPLSVTTLNMNGLNSSNQKI